jgi:hypothetical protein
MFSPIVSASVSVTFETWTGGSERDVDFQRGFVMTYCIHAVPSPMTPLIGGPRRSHDCLRRPPDEAESHQCQSTRTCGNTSALKAIRPCRGPTRGHLLPVFLSPWTVHQYINHHRQTWHCRNLNLQFFFSHITRSTHLYIRCSTYNDHLAHKHVQDSRVPWSWHNVSCRPAARLEACLYKDAKTFSKSPNTPRRFTAIVHKPVCSPFQSTTDGHRLEDMSCHPIPTWMWRAFLESTQTDVRANPAPPDLPMHPNYGERGILLPVPGVPAAGLPLVNSMPPKSTVPLPASGISIGDSSNNTYAFTCVDAASDFPVSIPAGTSHIPPPIESREKREPQDRPDQYKKSKKEGEVEPSRWSGRPADIHKAQFSCHDCGAKYVQLQGLNRHRREKHEPNLCLYCGAKWGRPYDYRNHLKKHHPGVDRDIELGKAAGSRRRSAIFVRRRSPQVSRPTIEHGRRGHSGIRQYPPAVVKPSPSTATLPPPDSDMTYVPGPESTQPIMTSNSISEGAVNCIILCRLF